MNEVGVKGGMKRQLFSLKHHFLSCVGLTHTHTHTKAATIKLRNERGIIRTSAHPKAEKTEEQQHKARHAHNAFACTALAAL